MLIASASIFLTIAYVAIMLAYRWGWRALPEWQIPESWQPSVRVSVIIPARNEAANIEACLRSILEGSYPANLLEIIVVDDFSGDETSEIVESLKFEVWSSAVCLIRLSDFLPTEARFRANKKKAIEIGIAHATGELIMTTDADCVVPGDWLRLVVSRFNPTPDPSPERRGDRDIVAEHATAPLPFGGGVGGGVETGGIPTLLAAPVAFHREQNFLQRFQSLDFLGLMGITGAGIQLGWQRMGNGANLAYPKAVFEEVGGFSGNENLASGDDMFLIQKVAARWPGSVFFLKNPAATVLTEAKPDWRSFLQQRLRWGTKNAALPEWPVRLVLLTVFLFCWSILLNSVLAALALVGVPANNSLPLLASPPTILLFQLSVKAVFDYIFLREMCRFFKREDLLRWFVPSFFLHTLYIPLVGAASLFLRRYEWKGRRTR
jgi:cellulose synthase/poly-beta-1,6-N-acetylglucosamine synthase-like glycosyltransferase